MARSDEAAPMPVTAGSVVSLVPGGAFSGGRFLDTDSTGMSVRFGIPTTTASTSISATARPYLRIFRGRGRGAGVQRGNYRRASRRGGRIVGRKRTDNPAEFAAHPSRRGDSRGRARGGCSGTFRRGMASRTVRSVTGKCIFRPLTSRSGLLSSSATAIGAYLSSQTVARSWLT